MRLTRTIPVVLLSLFAGVAVASDFRVTLLGTGSPQPRTDRFGPATLVEAGGRTLLFDVGRGAATRLVQLGVSLADVDAVFLTHFHHDHLIGLDDVWMTGWLPPYGGRRSPMEVWGPTGTKNLLSGLEESFELNTSVRVADQGLPVEGIRFLAHEFDEDSVIYEEGGVTVTAFAVDHGKLIKPAYGFRVDYDGRAVVISGDTRFDRNLIAAAKGADLLIHEVVLASEELLAASEAMRIIADHHTTPEEAGVVFSEVDPKLAVYTHLVSLGRPEFPAEPLKNLLPRTQVNYDGPLLIGEDLMQFDIGDKVSVSFPPGK
jgi:ribonuclease Z